MAALCLSGGGALGALQVGMLRVLTEERGFFWNRIAGVSVGAINGAFLSQFPATIEGAAAGAKALEKLWREQLPDSRAVYLSDVGDPSRFLTTGGMYDTEPLRKLVTSHWDFSKYSRSGVELSVGAVSFRTGDYVVVSPENAAFPQWIMASACFPCAFPPVYINNEPWLDGGVKHVAPLFELLEEKHKKIDVLMCNTITGGTLPASSNRAKAGLNVAIRTMEIIAAKSVRDDFEIAKVMASVLGSQLRILCPEDAVAFDPLKFEHGPISAMIEWGKTIARASHW